MLRRFVAAALRVVLAVVLTLTIPAVVARAEAPAGVAVADELLVAFHAGVSATEAAEVHRAHGATLLQVLPHLGVHRVRVPASTLSAVEQALRRHPRVKFVERNLRFSAQLDANDPSYGAQWHLPKISAPQAWDITTGRSNVVIAILDSGVDATHPDLAAKIVPGYNTYDGTSDTQDVYGHGTLVAGAAAAIGGNGEGIASPAWQNAIMPMRVTDTAGFAYTSTLADALTWATDHGARVLNMSFGGVAASSTILSASQYAMNHGAVVVAAAGNCGCFDATPQTPYILSVSATDQNDIVAGWSSSGPYVDLSAPGVAILTTAAGGGYASVSGTSFASPITAGVIALMLSVNPALPPATAVDLVAANSQDLGEVGWDPSYGAGRLDAERAVLAAVAYAAPPDTTAPSVAITAPSAGSVVTGTVTVSVSASDNVGVSGVDLYVDGAYYASSAIAPYTFTLDSTTLADGGHTLSARATDAAGNVGVSASDAISVQNTVPSVVDTTPPSVSIASTSITGKKLNVTVSATDDVAVTLVELYVDGTRAASDTAAPYRFTVSLNALAAGSHTLQARAYDAVGNIGTSTVRTITK